MASKSDITFSLGVEIDKNTVNASMSETERLLSSYKAKLEKSILKDFNTTVGGASTNRLFGGNKNAHIMSMRDDLGSLFKGINKSNTFTQMDKTLNRVADVFSKYQTGFKAGRKRTESKNAWLKKYSEENTAAFDKIYSTKKERAQADELKKRAKEETHEFDDVLNSFGNNANDLNVFEDRNRTYINLLKQRNDAKKKYNKTGDVDALKEYTSADQQIKALKDQEKEKKNNTKEEKGSLLRFGKMLATLHLIKKVLNAIKDIWKRLSDTELKVTSRDIKEKGFFGVDSYSAMHANVDRSHAVISRGLGYMGGAAPFSMESFDSVLQQLQDLNLKAISGQGIADDQLVISLQRLSDTLGMGFNITDILTDPNLNLTDFLTNLMNSVEKYLPKLNSLDDIEKSLAINDILKTLGPELANALVSNYNYNQRNGGTSTVMDLVTSKGTNAYGLIDYTEEAKKFSDALASTRGALDDFKISLAGLFAPAGKYIAEQVTEKAAEGTMLLNALNTKTKGWSYELTYSAAADLINDDREEQSDWYTIPENQEFANRMLEHAKGLKSFDDVLNYAYYNPTALAAGTSSAGLEQTIGLWKGTRVANLIQGKTYDEVKKEKDDGTTTFSDEEWAAIEDIYFTKVKDSWRFEGDNRDIFNTGSWKKFFGEGGIWDIGKTEPASIYAKDMIGEKGYQLLIASILAEKINFLTESGMMKEGGFSYYPSKDESGNIISGEITIKIDKTDGTSSFIPAKIENGVLKAVVDSQ
jgi:hypothetical protein